LRGGRKYRYGGAAGVEMETTSILAQWQPNSNRATAEGNRDPALKARMGFMT